MISTDNKHAVGVFTNRKAAEQSVNELKASSFPMEKVAIFAKFADRINPNLENLSDRQAILAVQGRIERRCFCAFGGCRP